MSKLLNGLKKGAKRLVRIKRKIDDAILDFYEFIGAKLSG
jgi:hypothetical protein